TYRGYAPMMRMASLHGVSPEEAEKRARDEVDKNRNEIKNAPRPPQSEIQVMISDYKAEGGMLLPHRFTRAAGGATFDETEITAYKINPPLKPQSFKKK